MKTDIFISDKTRWRSAFAIPVLAMLAYYLLCLTFAQLIVGNNLLLTFVVDAVGSAVGLWFLLRKFPFKTDGCRTKPGAIAVFAGYAAFGAFANGIIVSYLMTHVFYDESLAQYSAQMESTKVTVLGAVMTYFLSIVMAPLMEEILFRGFIFKPMYEFSPLLGYIISTAMFAWVHGTVAHWLIAGTSGLIFAAVYAKTRKIRYCIMMHMIYNGTTQLLSIIARDIPVQPSGVVFILAVAEVVFATIIIVMDSRKKEQASS